MNKFNIGDIVIHTRLRGPGICFGTVTGLFFSDKLMVKWDEYDGFFKTFLSDIRLASEDECKERLNQILKG